MKVSVVTASYNSAETISGTLRSVAIQSWPEIEHIIVDGGSTDDTLAVVEQQRDRVARLISEPDEGIYDAMNKGVAAASGDIVGFLNADDHYAHGDVISHVAEAMEVGGLDAVFGDVAFVRDAARTTIRRYRSNRFRPARLAWGWMPAHPTLFVRRELFRRVGPFATDYHIAGDFEWIVRAFWKSHLRYRHIPEVLVYMRTGGISTAGWRSTMILNREVMRACRENGISTNWLKILSKYPAKLLEFIPSSI